MTAILSITNENRQPLAVARPKCNSILHLFGEWLFDAAHIGSEMWLHSLKSKCYKRSGFSINYIDFLNLLLKSKQMKQVVDQVQ